MPRAVGEKPGGVPSTKPTFSWSGWRRGAGKSCAGAAASLSAAARGVSDTLPSNRAKCSLRGALRGGSAASGSACIGRRAGRYGESAALPRRAEVKPGFPHIVRIRTDTFLCPEKCPGCRVRWGETERSISFKAALFFARAALRGGEVLRGAAASLSAAARGVSDTLPSSRAKCSLRGALRGGSAASGSACIGRRAGQNEGERRPAAPGRPLAFFGRGCTIPYRETCFLKERENANGTTGKRP